MATAFYKATMGPPDQNAVSRTGVDGADDPITPSVTTAVADYATFLTDYDAVGAAIVAISGDTYSNTTHKFTNGGATGLTSAQLHTQTTALNTAITAFLAGNTALAAGSLAQSSTVLVAYDTALTTNQIKEALRDIITRLGN